MTSIEMVTELNTCLVTAARDRNEYMDGLNQFAKQFKAAKKNLLKMLKKETSKSKRKLLKKDLRKVEQVYQSIR